MAGRAQALLRPVAWTPRNIAGLRAWHAADRISGLADLDPVGSWADLSGRGNGLSQATGAKKPTYKAGILNGRPVVRFDGVDDALAYAGGVQVLTSQQFTIVGVVNSTAADGGGLREIVSNWDGGKGISSVFLGTSDPDADELRFTDNFAAAGVVFDKATHCVLAAVSEAANARTYRNGALLAAKGGALSTRNLGPDWFVGVQGTLNGEFWKGDIAELAIYDGALSDGARRRLERYLGAKWGIGVA